jgi:hypothetical protein
MLVITRARGVEIIISGSGSFNTSAPTSSDITNWGTGWGSPSVSGWDYVGFVNGASGVYLGNGWVLTAAHVGETDFTLAGTTYPAVPGSAQELSGTTDLTLFQLEVSPNLPALSIATSAPGAASALGAGGSEVAMIGNGGGVESWGLNTVTETDVEVQLQNHPYTTTDFETDYGDPPPNFTNIDNDAVLIGGDSGGGDFIYNSRKNEWQLAGINEGVDSSDNSYMVQLGTYATQINPIIAVPEPGAYWLTPLGALLILAWRRRAVTSPITLQTSSAPPRAGTRPALQRRAADRRAPRPS